MDLTIGVRTGAALHVEGGCHDHADVVVQVRVFPVAVKLLAQQIT